MLLNQDDIFTTVFAYAKQENRYVWGVGGSCRSVGQS